jgi:hypothetical protein
MGATKIRAFLLLAPLLLLQSACGCDASVEFSVAVDVVDARTGAWAAHGATGTLEIGNTTDSLRVTGYRGSPPNDTATTLGTQLSLAGPFRVRVAKVGYFLWEDQGVVHEGRCGVNTVHLTARLVRIG